MQESVSDWIVGVMVAVFGLVGLFLASGARDIEMTVFGFGLVIFSVLFVIGVIRRHYDMLDAARVAVRTGDSGHG